MGQKIKTVTIENFKAIANLQAQIEGKSVLLIGENDRGKTSFIQAIEYALGITETQPQQPYHNDADKLGIQVTTTGDGKEYTFTVDGKDGKKPKVQVIGPDGIPSSKKGVIGQLVGAVEFDVWEFVQLSKTKSGRQKQIEIVKSLLPEETQTYLTKIKDRINQLYEQREELGRSIKTQKGFIESSGIDQEDFDQYSEYKDIEALQNEYNQKLEANHGFDERKKELEETLPNKKEEIKGEINDIDNEIADLEAKIKSLKEKRENRQNEVNLTDQRIKEIQEELDSAGGKYDLEEVNQRIKDARDHNSKVDQVKQLSKTKEELETNEETYRDYTERIDRGRSEYQETIKNSDLPIDDLYFDEEQGVIYYMGYPVDENQLSESTIMMLGARIKMAQSKNFNVLFMNGLQDLGQQKFDELINLCDQYGFQLIGEQVERGQDELKIEIIPGETKSEE